MADLNDPDVKFAMQVSDRLVRLEVMLGNLQLVVEDIRRSTRSIADDMSNKDINYNERFSILESGYEDLRTSKVAAASIIATISTVAVVIYSVFGEKLRNFFN